MSDIKKDLQALAVDYQTLAESNARQAGELVQLRLVLQGMQLVNMNLSHRISVVDDWLTEWTGTDVNVHVYEAAEKLGEALAKVEVEIKMPGNGLLRTCFHWRAAKRADGTHDFFCGEGFGFLGAAPRWLAVQFECGGISAHASIHYEQLGVELAKVGLSIVPATHEQTVRGLLEKVELLERQLAFAEKLTEQIATVDDRRVLDALGRVPVEALKQHTLRSAARVWPQQELDHLVGFELARRIQAADLDLPHYMSDREVIETSLERLFEMLDDVTEEGEKAKAMTPEQREDRYEAYIRAQGWLKPGEVLDRSRMRKHQERVSDETSSSSKDGLQIRDVQSDGAPESEPD